jgi:hypothetical protein
MRKGVRIPQEERDADEEQRLAALAWTEAISSLYAAYIASRGSKFRRETQVVENA